MNRSALVMLISVLLAGCGGPDSPRGFSLPRGDVERGEATFVFLGCPSCHTVEGVDVAGPSDSAPISVPLGGTTRRVKTYGELVTSIINPSHRLAESSPIRETMAPDGSSRMTVYNDVMTVSQLVDLVAFLETHYTLPDYTTTDYPLLP